MGFDDFKPSSPGIGTRSDPPRLSGQVPHPLQYTQFYDNLLQISYEIAEDAYLDGVRAELR
jgi:hypothetical protein